MIQEFVCDSTSPEDSADDGLLCSTSIWGEHPLEA
jgi:hypothetical protein